MLSSHNQTGGLIRDHIIILYNSLDLYMLLVYNSLDLTESDGLVKPIYPALT